jgi:eukaryotic-like serine/threonine-protein kinase
MSSPPQTLGQYQIIREIARSNDIVYEAYDPLMNRRVAVKELSMPAGSTPQQLEDRVNRFRREVQAVGSLNHPNIMTVYSFSEDAGRHFMAMEFLDGVTLRKEIDNHGFLTQDRAIEIITEILEGLDHAHEKGVVHRDIKPDNIQITSSGVVKITDFGIARLTFQPNLTMDGQVFGTPSYMSPEQIVGKDIDNRTDLFSVGVMLYEMLTGTKPFLGDNVIAITHAIVNTAPSAPTQVSFPLWEVVKRSLEKAPQMRHHNANEMRVALRDAVAPVAQTPPPAVSSPYAQPPTSLVSPSYGSPPPMGIGAPPIVASPQPYQNPYGQAPYAQSPYGQTPYGGVTPAYDPYGQSSYHPSGYGNAMPPPVVAQPPSYGQYNPYQQPMVGQYPPPQNGVFYPPPPGQPLVSQETREKMRHFISALIILGILAAIVVVAFMAITNSVQKSSSNPQRAKTTREKTAAPATSNSSDDRVAGSSGTARVDIDGGPPGIPMRNESGEPPYTGPAPDFYIAEANKASTPEARARGYILAGEAYAQTGDRASAFQMFETALQTLEENNSPKAERRKVLYRMQEITEPGSRERLSVDERLAAL